MPICSTIHKTLGLLVEIQFKETTVQLGQKVHIQTYQTTQCKA